MTTAKVSIPLLFLLLAASNSYSQSEYRFGVEKTESNLMLPMRDGVRLATDIYRPTQVRCARGRAAPDPPATHTVRQDR